jgi:N-methylhydantoinase A
MTPLDGDELTEVGLTRLIERFHTLHRQRFSFDDITESVELVTLRLTARGRMGGGARCSCAISAPEGQTRSASRTRPVFLDGDWRDAGVFAQAELAAGDMIAGPAIIEQPYTTLFIPAGWRLEALASGDLLAQRPAI